MRQTLVSLRAKASWWRTQVEVIEEWQLEKTEGMSA